MGGSELKSCSPASRSFGPAMPPLLFPSQPASPATVQPHLAPCCLPKPWCHPLFPLMALFLLPPTPAEHSGSTATWPRGNPVCPLPSLPSAQCCLSGLGSQQQGFPPPFALGARAQEVAALIPCTWLSLDHWGLEREGLGRVGTLRVPLPSRFSLVVPVCTHGIVHGTVWQHWPGAPQHRFAMLSAGPFL